MIINLLQFTALTWIKEFVQLSGRMMVPFASGILTAVLPCLSYDSDAKKSILYDLCLNNLDITTAEIIGIDL